MVKYIKYVDVEIIDNMLRFDDDEGKVHYFTPLSLMNDFNKLLSEIEKLEQDNFDLDTKLRYIRREFNERGILTQEEFEELIR